MSAEIFDKSREGFNKKVWGWSDELFKQIIESSISYTQEGGFILTDISSPPGTKKTLNVIRYAVENRIDMIASFPNHQNQATALKYIFSALEKEKPRKLKQFVIDYAGLENYCLFYKPELLMKLLDKFKTSPNDSYVDAVQNMLGESTIFQILLARDTYDVVEEIWMAIAELLDRYKTNRNKQEYLSKIKIIVEKKGQYEICTGICPLGLFAWWHRRRLYKFFSDPKIITWRKIKEDYFMSKYPHVARHIVRAHPVNFVENIDKILEGEFKPEWFLCPRYLLLVKISLSPKSNRPTFIATRKSIILVPHSGLEFILSVVSRQLEITNIRRRYLLFLDEYDTLLKPKTWPVFSLEIARAIVAIANNVINTPIGERYKGVVVTQYLKRYAEYVRDVLSEIISIVEQAIETKNYHPLANIFLEGAFSHMVESTIKTKVPIEYRPLGARVVHIKHFLMNSRLLQLILNPKLYFYDLAERDREWNLKYREAVVSFRQLLHGVKTLARLPVKINHPQPQYGKVLTLRMFEVDVVDILSIIRDYVKQILLAPRFACFYIHNPGRMYHKIKLASIDVQIYKLLTWSQSAILTSATPVVWNALVAGTNLEGLASSEYERVVTDISHSLITFESPQHLSYDVKEEIRYSARLMIYNKEFLKELRDSLRTGRPVAYSSSATMRTEIYIRQISPKTSKVREYTNLLRIVLIPPFNPLLKSTGANPLQRILIDVYLRSLHPYINVLGLLYSKKDTILVLTQNKTVAKVLSTILHGTPCLGGECGSNISKLSHYLAKKRIVITWFRSRAGRGIDLPFIFDSVVVIGSPYPRPQTIVHFKSASISPYSTRFDLPAKIVAYNDRTVYSGKKTLTPRDFMNGIAEMVQAVGRATRSVMYTGNKVVVYVPLFLLSKIYSFAPYWFRASIHGVVI